MAIAQRKEFELPKQQAQPDLRVIETPPSPVRPYDEKLHSNGTLAIAIGGLVTVIREMYQKDMGATSGIDYELKRAKKRGDMVNKIFREFHMIEGTVALEAGEEAGREPAKEVETPFQKAYRKAERTVLSGDMPRSEMIDLVVQHYDHPVLRTLAGLQRIQQTGALAEDTVTAMRASAMLLHEVEPPTPEQ